ncbi:MAG: BatA domain-containing protein, partial [Pseudomonadota bacterium]
MSFAQPLILLALMVLPLLWILLRAIPPAPVLRRFPAVTLLLGLKEKEVEADKTPWWLLLLRAFALGALIFGFAGPFWQPSNTTSTDRPLMVLMDGGWSETSDWQARQDQAVQIIQTAGRNGRSVAFVHLAAADEPPVFGPAGLAERAVGGAQPLAWLPAQQALDLSQVTGDFDTYWLPGPVAIDGQDEI